MGPATYILDKSREDAEDGALGFQVLDLPTSVFLPYCPAESLRLGTGTNLCTAVPPEPWHEADTGPV